jgi:hypothetical protein
VSFESIDDPAEVDLQEPRWLQLAFAAMGAFVAVGVAVWGLMTPGPVNVGGVVVGEAFGWLLCLLYVRELTKPRPR